MIGRGDQDGVNVLAIEQFAEILVLLDVHAALFEHGGGVVAMPAIHVAHRDILNLALEAKDVVHEL